MLTLIQADTMLSMKDAAKRLGVSVMTVRRLVWSGELPAFKIRGRMKVDPDALEQYRQQHAYQPKPREDEERQP